jgi:GNAT superfamily N-acetyltransferase
MNTIRIREAVKEDMKSVHKLILELARFEASESAVNTTAELLQRDGFSETPRFKCWVAENEGNIVGMAFVYPRYSTWVGQVLHLEDLIITESSRGLGIGGRLLDEVVKYGHSLGVKRISWEVLDWNEPAIKFYEERGARVMRDWDVVQLDEMGIIKYLEKL